MKYNRLSIFFPFSFVLCKFLGDITAIKFNIENYTSCIFFLYYTLFTFIYAKIEYKLYKKKTTEYGIEYNIVFRKLIIYCILCALLSVIAVYVFKLEQYGHDYVNLVTALTVLFIALIIEFALKIIKKHKRVI
jgi:hypothetical protein